MPDELEVTHAVTFGASTIFVKISGHQCSRTKTRTIACSFSPFAQNSHAHDDSIGKETGAEIQQRDTKLTTRVELRHL